jgi:hypothetical protein
MQVTHAIVIRATPDVVWAVTTDVARWPEWTPTVTAVERVTAGELRVGSVVRLKQPMQPHSDWVVTELQPQERFAWETRRTGLRMIGSHELTAVEGGTRNVLRVDVSGIIGVILWPILRFATRKALADENRGLKARCERQKRPG